MGFKYCIYLSGCRSPSKSCNVRNSTPAESANTHKLFHHLIIFYPSGDCACISITTGQQLMQPFPCLCLFEVWCWVLSFTPCPLQWSPSGRCVCVTCVCVCVLMVSAITSPFILSAVTDPVLWLWIMGRERARPEAPFAVFCTVVQLWVWLSTLDH